MGLNFITIFAISLFNIFVVRATEPCTIPATSESGQCIPLQDCPGIVEEFKKDRRAPVICNQQLRKVCCPLRFTTQATTVTESIINGTTEESIIENDSDDADSETFIASQIVKKCIEYKKLLIKNETVNSFILGEPPTFKKITFCNQNKKDVGVASSMEFPHIAIIKIDDILGVKVQFNMENKCVGSLISDRHVITSMFCVKSLINLKVTVYLGVHNFDLTDETAQAIEVDSVDTKYGVSVLKLTQQVKFNEAVMPICLFPYIPKKSEFLLTAWTGDWRECDLKLKKWHIDGKKFGASLWQIFLNQSEIINYRQTLLYGSPLQIYHPEETCQYSLIGFYEHSAGNKYAFNLLYKKLRWIEQIVWPKKVMEMSFKTFQVIVKKALF